MFQVILIGFGAGALYALAALGIVLIHRGSGVVNFAQGGFGLVGAYVYWEMHVNHKGGGLHGFWPALVLGLLAPAVLGFLTHYLIMRPLAGAAAVSRLIATVGVLGVITALATLKFDTNVNIVPAELPTRVISVFGAKVGLNIVILFLISIGLSLLLWIFYRWTNFGRATTAVSENRAALASLGRSPDLVAACNWAIGGALAGFSGVFLTMFIGLSANSLTSLLLPSLAAAFVGNMNSFPLTLLGGLLLGAGEGLVTRYVDITGIDGAVPLAVIMIPLLLRGRRFEGRSTQVVRLPFVTSGRINPIVFCAVVATPLVLVWFVLSPAWIDTMTLSAGLGCILLSITLITGFTGQLSLAQLTLAGVGAWAASQVMAQWGVPYILALPAGVFAAIPIGIVVGLPALRTRGVSVAIATLALAVTIEAMIFNNIDLTGGQLGTYIKQPNLFGWSLDNVEHPQRYFTMSLVVLVVAVLAVANTRRGGTGRMLLAVRSNERAAASLGINVTLAKLYAFALAAGIAAAGGVLLTFRNSYVDLTVYSANRALDPIAQAVVGGLGSLSGGVVGAQLQPGSTGSAFIGQYIHSLDTYLPLIGGIALLLVLLTAPDGIVKQQADQARFLARSLTRRRTPGTTTAARTAAAGALRADTDTESYRVAPKTLRAEHVTVRFGGVVAIHDVSIEVGPGEVVGLIGPNGAGKTTLIEAVTGYVRPASGSIRLDGASLERVSPHKRSRAGLARSFQTLELFEDLTVLENLLAASDPRTVRSTLRDLVAPPTRALATPARAAVEEFGLADKLSLTPKQLSYGDRRLVAIARAVGSGASILLLDEPAAGLSGSERAELARMLRTLAERWGIGVLLVEHDVELVMTTCDRVTALELGGLLATGSPAEIRANPDVIRAYLGVAEDAPPAPDPSAAEGQFDAADVACGSGPEHRQTLDTHFQLSARKGSRK